MECWSLFLPFHLLQKLPLSLLHFTHPFRIPGPFDTFLRALTVQFGMQVISAFMSRFLFFHRNAMGVGVGIVTDAGDLPRNFHAGFSASDLETVAGDFFCHVEVWSWSADGRELVAKVTIQRLKPCWKLHPGFTVGIEDGVAVVNIHHVRGFDKGVVEILVFGIERVIDFEPTA